MAKNLSVHAEDARDSGLIPVSGRFPGVRNGNPIQYSGLENSTERGAWLWGTTESLGHKELDTIELTGIHKILWFPNLHT